MEDRYVSGKKASIVGITLNIFLFIIKAIIGVISMSQAMLSDALNSGGDIINSFCTYLGNRIASRPRDEDHVMGHGKAEYIFALLMSGIIIYISCKQIYKSVLSIINNEQVNFSYWLIIVCLLTIIIKFMMYLYVNSLYKKHNNILLKANAVDHISDCAVTSVTLFAVIMSLLKIPYVDGVVGILISSWIIYVELKIFFEAYDVLMDKGIDDETKQRILNIIDKYEEVKGVNHFNSTPVGYRYQINFTIYVDGNLTTFASHDIADKLEHEIGALDEVYLVRIHVNPYKEKKND